MKRILGIATLIVLQTSSPFLYANGLSDSITSSTVKSKDDVKEDKNSDTNGREYKAGDAQKQGNTGAGAAVATGAALMAAAIPLLASIDPVQVAAGADLMAKAGMEFGQAGADAGSASKNKAQKDLLTNKNAAGETGSQETGKPTGSSIKSPELDKLLADRGINSDDFKEKLASGQITNPQDVLSSMGDSTQFSAEDLEQGAALADSQTASVFNDMGAKKGDSESASVVFNEKTDSGNTPGGGGADSGGGFASYANSPGGQAEGQIGANSADAIKQSVLGLKSGRGATGGGTVAEAKAGAGGFDAAAFVKNMFGGTNVVPTKTAAFSLLKQGLERVGILIPPKNQNIFQVARRNFYSFGKWRKSMRIASTSK